MIDHCFIWVDGSRGSGKTTLIERILESNRTRHLAGVRFSKNNKLRQPKVIEHGNEETRRYQKAGAGGTLLLEYPDNDKASMAEYFWCSGFLGEMYNAVYCEAELTDDDFPADLSVFVIPAAVDPTTIFETHEIKVGREFMRKSLTEAFGHIRPIMERFSKSFDQCIEEALTQSADELEALPPLRTLRLAPGFEGLITASTIIVNIRDDNERPAAERLLVFINEAGTKPNCIENTFGYFWRPKKSMFIANLSNPKDPELKKAITMIKRRTVSR